MRLVKYILSFSIFCFSFILSFSCAKAEEKISLNFEGYKINLPFLVYKDFDLYMKEKNLDYYLTTNNNTGNVYMVFFANENSLKFSFKDSGWVGTNLNVRYLRLYNNSDTSLNVYYCEFNTSLYNGTSTYSKQKCLETIDNFIIGTSKYVIPSNGYYTGNYSISAFQINSSGMYNVPFYISNESLSLILEEDFIVRHLDSDYDFTTLTTKDLFYANHNDLFKTESSTGTVDLTSVEKLLYFICFILFAFFIVLIFKIAIRFIHMILPI